MDDQFTTQLSISILFFIVISTIDDVTAQNLADRPSQTNDSVTNFQPSLAVVISLLSIMFSLTFLLLLYAKFCHRRRSSAALSRRTIQDALLLRSASGLDKALVQSLPFFKFSSLKGSREGLECAVCLSRFEDIEVLRMLPKCKHAFHIGCIDYWLEKHSTCPLCRRRVEENDLSELQYSSSLRFLWDNQTELMRDDEESTLELYVEREDNNNNNNNNNSKGRSSRFSIVGGSFRDKADKGKIVIDHSDDENKNRYSNVSDIVMKNRWSDVSSSDIMLLNSEMISDVSNARFSSSRNDHHKQKYYSLESIVSIKEEMERKRVFESKMREMMNINRMVIGSDYHSKQKHGSKDLMNGNNENMRSMSEIIVHPRFVTDQLSNNGDYVADQEEMMRRSANWLPIARKTVEWFANREKMPPQFHV